MCRFVIVPVIHGQLDVVHCSLLSSQCFPFSDEQREECDTIVWSTAFQTFPKFVQLLDLPEFRCRLILGLIVSVGGLTEKTVLCSTEALTAYLVAHESNQDFLIEFLATVERVANQYSNEERIILSLLKFVDFLLNDPVVTSSVNGDCPVLLNLIEHAWNQVKRCRDVHRIKAAIDVFGGMLQFEEPVRQRAANLMMILLGHRYPVVRKSTATKLYECLVVFELIEPEAMDQLTTLLTETIWESDLDEVRPIRNEICKLLGLRVPRLVDPKSSTRNDTPTDQTSSTISVNGEAGDCA